MTNTTPSPIPARKEARARVGITCDQYKELREKLAADRATLQPKIDRCEENPRTIGLTYGYTASATRLALLGEEFTLKTRKKKEGKPTPEPKPAAIQPDLPIVGGHKLGAVVDVNMRGRIIAHFTKRNGEKGYLVESDCGALRALMA